MDDELEWLRGATPQISDLDDAARQRAHGRLLAEISPRAAIEHDGRALEDLPIESLSDDDVADDRTAGGRVAVLGSIAAAVAVIAGIALAVRSGSDETPLEDVAGDDFSGADGTLDVTVDDDTSVGALDTRDEVTPIPLGLSEDDDLSDGQSVTLTGDGFAIHSSVWVVQCATPRMDTTILEGCDLATTQHSKVDGDGSLGVDIRAHRFIRVDGAEIDCSVATCAISVALIDDHRLQGTIPLTFDASAAPTEAPELVVGATTDLLDGQELTVSGSGFEPSSEVRLVQCVIGVVERTPNCFQRWRIDTGPTRSGQRHTTDPDGRFEATIYANRLVRTVNDQVDCANSQSGRCLLAVIPVDDTLTSSQRLLAAQPLVFDETFDPPTIGVAIEPRSGFSDGAPITITVTGVHYPEIQLCAVGWAERCIGLSIRGGAQRGSTFSVELELPRLFDAQDGRDHDCVEDGPCELRIDARGFPSDPLPIVYDASSPLADPIAVISGPDGPHLPGDVLTLTVPPVGSLVVRQCVVDIPADGRTSDYCDVDILNYKQAPVGGELDSTGSFINDDGLLQVEMPIYRRLILPGGRSHDCVTGGRCQLIVTSPLLLARYSPVPVELDPTVPPLSDPSIVISATSDLVDGQVVTVSVSDIGAATTLDIQLCSLDMRRGSPCPSIEQYELAGSSSMTYDVAIPRLTIYMTGRPIDCAQTCELRVTTGRTSAYASIFFDSGSDFLPPPTLEIDPVPDSPGDRISVGGEGFPARSTSDQYLDIYLCENQPPNFAFDRVTSGCGVPERSMWEAEPTLGPDGSFTGALLVPDGFQPYNAPGITHNCLTASCWLVVATHGAGPTLASVQLTEG